MTLDDLYVYALTKYHMPYEWGGSGPGAFGHYGFDCSGLVEDYLKFGGIAFKTRMNSRELYTYFSTTGLAPRGRGDLCFFGTADNVCHVGWRIDDKIIISAAGGGSHVTTLSKATLLNARVEIEPISWFKFPAFVAAFHPRYPFEGG